MLAENVYFDNQFNVQAAKLLPGEFYATTQDMVLVTVLGSCVAACIRDRLSGIGGMNHFMLPDARDDGSPISTSARYGTNAMEVLINKLITMGAHRTLLEAKVFGGGNVLPGMTTMNIGEKNAQFVKRFLGNERIPIVASDLVDVYPRKVYFFPKSGKVLVKKLRTLHNETIFEREKEYGQQLVRGDAAAGEVELFGSP